MNSTCIHLRTGGQNIYMYMKGKIYKEPSEGIQKIEKTNIHLTSPSPQTHGGSKNTEFGEVKLMMGASLSLREEICQLKL
jgi:hypothetical protein